ncbi:MULTISPECIES: aa3-type cytochrome oxidase subunit III [unclassified Streptomyces]|uniref:aa3-type cytochrome oxidase subunit III n=1 Tax=unclassified Streptomyces TaxID=2593676 RepID=UPI00225948DF|nr:MULTISPECIES: heme-copper oxidase subunit III [unclassified Streptomyces]WSP54645.1 heme-copper oxidase subunit III [Streptomyces sp. NBC_01241]WSU24678.1 heme-copper oxidase subunit III [Streptomyces sp. NBC_01108]MCX4786200.1 heme-copper oxidase subunit III [Streptomyces sp. NBC_01221]MCX4797943.1 heme-copper oxidase subunit III [Streptomyces sp. NBC_01242]WSJ39212.1 heme-copper oxidase subunit III [Streptomyces sp. NBC_01321]
MSSVATATTVETGHAHPSVNRPNLTSVGTIIWLSSELMFFAALFAMYFTLRSVMGPAHWKEMASALNFPFSATNTTILVLSSLTCQLGVFAAERGDVKKLRTWFVITFVMGAIFIGGQIFEYTELVKVDGLSLSSDPYGSVFYLTTGFHGLHVTGGLIAFLLVLGRTYAAKRFTHEQATAAIVVSYYWHFVDVVWIGLFATIYMIK